MLIKRGDKTKFYYGGDKTSFTLGDFYVGDSYWPTGEFDLNAYIMRALVEICIEYGLKKTKINSTRRTTLVNSRQVQASETSRHLYGEAIDFSFTGNSVWSSVELHAVYKRDIQSRGPLFQKLFALGVREFFFYKTFNHIALEPGKPAQIIDFSDDANDIVKTNIKVKPTPQTVETPVHVTASKDFYEYYHQDSSLNTVSKLLKASNPIVKSVSMTKEEFLNYQTPTRFSSKTNLDRIWNVYTPEQKYRFSKEYASLVDKQLASEVVTEQDSYISQRNKLSVKYDSSLDYEINVGTIIALPKNKTNIEVFAVQGKDLFMKQQDLKTFLDEEFAKIANSPDYVKSTNTLITNGQYTVNYLDVTFNCWIYSRALDIILNISPFIKSMDTNVAADGGSFSFTLNDLDDFKGLEQYSETFYSYVQKVTGTKYNTSFFKKYIQQNDIVFIRFERLDLESAKDRSGNWDLFIDESEIPGKIYDMIGLVDSNSEGYAASGNTSNCSVSGRDLTKMLIEDGSYFFNLALMNNSKAFFLNFNQEDEVFKRLWSTGQFINKFNLMFRSIRDSLGFVFNRLTNTGIIPKGRDLFKAYGDSKSKIYKINGVDQEYLDAVECNGIWQIIKMVVDHQLDERRLCNGELSNPDGALLDLIRKICQEPFVEFWGDTLGDKFVFMARQPPFTRKQIQNYFTDNNHIVVTSDVVTEVNLNWETTYYTWYQIMPLMSLFGSNQTMLVAYLPIIYFEEYASLFGMHKKIVNDNYMPSGFLSGDQEKQNVDIIRDSYAEDLKFMIESNSILPFTRKGTIKISGGDRRIKKGMWIEFAPTDEIYYVQGVSNSVSITGDSISRDTVLTVERGMKKEYVLGDSKAKIDGKSINYFDIVNVDVIKESLKIRLADDKMKISDSGTNVKIVNEKVFKFFSTRQQW